MSANHAQTLFSRDLKHLVDSKHTAAPVRKRRALLAWLLCSSALAAAVYGTAVLLVPYITNSPSPQTARMTIAPGIERIAPQTAAPEKATLDPGNDPAQKEADRPSPEPNDSDKITTNPEEKQLAAETNGTEAGETPVNPPSEAEPTGLVWQDYKVKGGDSLAKIFTQHQLPVADAIRIAGHEQAKAINKLVPGQKLRIGYDHDNDLRALSLELRSNKSLLINLDPDGSLRIDEFQREFDKREVASSAVIESSLFKAGAQAGLDDKFILKLINIFSWDIDFAMDLKKGDRFTVVYEQLVDGQTSKGTGDILAAEFVNQDRRLYAFRHSGEQGKAEYFDAEGNSLRGTFLRTPMKISRITSGFSKKRLHPILKEWRTHKGVDYAAPRGTPVLATADGRVGFLGRKDGYGKAVVLKHGSKYTTLYAHLSSYKSKLRPGSNVKQGQVIGFVGRTGMATAPHLHYEFRVHGDHRDPLSYEFPKAGSIQGEEREKFLAKAQHWMEAMAQYNGIQLAQNEQSQ